MTAICQGDGHSSALDAGVEHGLDHFPGGQAVVDAEARPPVLLDSGDEVVRDDSVARRGWNGGFDCGAVR